MQQPMPNPEDIIDPTTAMNMALVLRQGLKLKLLNTNQQQPRISSDLVIDQIAQPGMNKVKQQCGWLEPMVGISLKRQNVRQNVGGIKTVIMQYRMSVHQHGLWGIDWEIMVINKVLQLQGLGSVLLDCTSDQGKGMLRISTQLFDCSKGRSRNPTPSEEID
ncbi:hypothetical protein Tco_1576037 [Tanacetum coccineum]